MNKQIVVLKLFRLIAFVLFLLGTGISLNWLIVFGFGLKTHIDFTVNFKNTSREERIYNKDKAAAHLSKGLLSLSCGMVALWSTIQISKQIKRLDNP